MPQLATFYLGKEIFAVDILITKEIGKISEVTKVPGAPDFILGLLNLRGQVVTLIDPSHFLDQQSLLDIEARKLMILKTQSELIELQRNGVNVITALSKDPMAIVVDQIGDVIDIDSDDILPVPPNITGNKREFVTGVVQLEKQLIIILAMDKLSKICAEVGKKMSEVNNND